MRILLSGSHGLVGSELLSFLRKRGHEVICLVRSPLHREDAIDWDPSKDLAKKEQFEGFDAVIHLAGASIAQGRWSKKRKKELFLSRCRDTWLLSHLLTRVNRPPKTFICASAIGYYGDRGEETLTEGSSAGSGFLADLCQQWERATDSLAEKGVRVVSARFGPILSEKGGLLPQLIKPIRWGLGVYFGSGNNFISWIALEDVIGALYHVLMTPAITSPVNFTSPAPVRQKELIHKIATRVGGRAPLHLSEGWTKILFGEMATEVLLASQKVIPHRLIHSGYAFIHHELEGALRKLLH